MNKAWIIVAKKEMTRVWDDWKMIPVTIVKIFPQEVLRFKTQEKDGYDAVVVWVNKKELKKDKWMKVKYSMTTEFKNIDESFLNNYKPWTTIDINLLEGVEEVSVRWTSKGKGFQGVIKRWGMKRQGRSHGTHESKRGTGSIGQCAWPSRVWKGKHMAGRMGNDQVTVSNLEVLKIIPEKNIAQIYLEWIEAFYFSPTKVTEIPLPEEIANMNKMQG